MRKPITLPGTGLSCQPLALGTAEFGSAIAKETSFEILDRFVAGGGTVIDTARVYADWLPEGHGQSESTVGHWLQARGVRDRVIISTKGGHPRLESMDVPRLAPEEILADAEESLACLGIDTIDMYWLHRDDVNRPVEEIVDTLNILIKDNKIRYCGCSNWLPERIEAAMAYARRSGQQAFAASQIQWSLAEMNEGSNPDPTTVAMDEDQLRFYTSSQLGVFAFTPQAKGFFQKLHAGGSEALRDQVRQMYYNEANLRRLHRAVELSQELGCRLSAVVLGYLINQPIPTVPVIGASSTAQVEEALAALEVALSPDQLRTLEHA